MSAHASVPLGEVCKVNPRGRKARGSGDLPVSFVPMAAVDERWGEIRDREARPLAEVARGYSSFRTGDVLFAKITPCMENGKVAVARALTNGIGRGSTEFYVLRPGDSILADYLFFYLRQPSFRKQAKRHFTGTAGQQRVPKSFMENATILLPPLDEQRRIVAILNRAAKIERLRARAAERLREFVPALFVEMFGDPVENPRGWKVAPLGEVIEGFEAGKNVKAGNGTTPFRILKVSAVTSGEFDPSMSKPAPDDHVAPMHHHVRVGDLLISRANTSDLVGATAMVEREAPDILLPDKIWRFVWRSDSPVESRFIQGLFQNPATRRVISAMASGTSSSMKNISQAKLKTLRIIVPPLDQQSRYGELVAKARELFSLAEAASKCAAALSSSLMAKLISSEGTAA